MDITGHTNGTPMTTEKDPLQAVIDLAKNPSAMNLSAAIRFALPAIEAAMAAGVRQENIIAELHLKTTPATFRRTLFRIRKEQASLPAPVKTESYQQDTPPVPSNAPGEMPDFLKKIRAAQSNSDSAPPPRRTRNLDLSDGKTMSTKQSDDPVSQINKGRPDNPDTSGYFE